MTDVELAELAERLPFDAEELAGAWKAAEGMGWDGATFVDIAEQSGPSFLDYVDAMSGYRDVLAKSSESTAMLQQADDAIGCGHEPGACSH